MSEEQVVESEEQADQLIAEAEGNAPANGPIGEEAQAAPAPAAAEEFSFKFNGKDIKGTRDQILSWAQRGYDAPNKIGELTKKLQEYTAKEPQFKQWQEQFGPVDEYVRKNPDWWQHVNNSWKQLQEQRQADPNNPVLQNLSQEVSQLKELASTVITERQQKQIEEQDKAYMSEIETVKKQYPMIDLSTPDENGKSLEYKVLEYAQTNGIRKFTTAFRDFYHDELVKINSEQAKEKVAKDKMAKTKLGIIDSSRLPTTRKTDSVRGKTYNQLADEALDELGIAR